MNKIYRGRCIPMNALWCHQLVIMADFLMPETQQPIIVIILIINSSRFLKILQEYISPRSVIRCSFYESYVGL